MRNAYLGAGFFAIILAIGFIMINQEYLNPQKRTRAKITRGQFYLEQDNEDAWRKAVDEFTKAASIYPGSAAGREAVYYLANAYEKLGMLDIAQSKYRKLHKHPLSEDMKKRVRFKLAKIQILRSYSDEGKSGLLALLAQTQEKTLRSEIYTELGHYYYKKRDFAQAQKNYEIALAEDSENKDARVKLAKSLTAQGKHKAAYSVYETYLTHIGEIDPRKKTVVTTYKSDILSRGMALFHKGAFAKSIEHFQLVASRFAGTPQAEDGLYYTGIAYFKMGSYYKAIESFNKVITHSPATQDDAAMVKKGEAYYQLKNFEKAAATFAEARARYGNGRYGLIARDWEEESKRAIQERYRMNKPAVVEPELEPERESSEPSLKGRIQESETRTELIEEPDLDEGDLVTP